MGLSKKEIAVTIRNLHRHVDFLKEVSDRLKNFSDRCNDGHVLRNASYCASASRALFEYISESEYKEICNNLDVLDAPVYSPGTIDTF